MGFDIMNVQVEEMKKNIDDYSWSLYGVGGIGKTSLAGALFDDPAFWQGEVGQNALRAKKIPVTGWKSPSTSKVKLGIKDHILALQKGIASGKPKPFRTAIMDTVDVIAGRYCKNHVCKLRGWEHPSDGEWGKGWDAVSEEFELEMDKLEKLGIKPVYISHDKDKEFKPKGREKYNKITPSVTAGFLKTVFDKVDFVGYCTYETIKDDDGNEKIIRVIYFRDNGEHMAKSHLRYFPEKIEFGDTPEETANRIKKAFYKAIELEERHINKGSKKITQKSKKEDSPRAESKKVKAVNDNSVVETEKESRGNNLDELKDMIDTILKEKYKNKEMTAAELVEVVEKYTGQKKVPKIDDIKKAQELLKALS